MGADEAALRCYHPFHTTTHEDRWTTASDAIVNVLYCVAVASTPNFAQDDMAWEDVPSIKDFHRDLTHIIIDYNTSARVRACPWIRQQKAEARARGAAPAACRRARKENDAAALKADHEAFLVWERHFGPIRAAHQVPYEFRKACDLRKQVQGLLPKFATCRDWRQRQDVVAQVQDLMDIVCGTAKDLLDLRCDIDGEDNPQQLPDKRRKAIEVNIDRVDSLCQYITSNLARDPIDSKF